MSEEERKEAARKMGQARSDKKREASAVSLEKARAVRWTPEARAAHAEIMRNVYVIDIAIEQCPAEWEDIRLRNWIRANLSKDVPIEQIVRRREKQQRHQEGGEQR